MNLISYVLFTVFLVATVVALAFILSIALMNRIIINRIADMIMESAGWWMVAFIVGTVSLFTLSFSIALLLPCFNVLMLALPSAEQPNGIILMLISLAAAFIMTTILRVVFVIDDKVHKDIDDDLDADDAASYDNIECNEDITDYSVNVDKEGEE